ncbi:TetR/AcrR family transcriptional regulator [Gammaproteobacteria bacterium]|nr:TetR/AcrR family transcriptional regulator [Gammaproteobacteria bacterium]
MVTAAVMPANKRDLIITTTVHLVNERGLAHVPVSLIAEQANISPATVYIHFRDKQDLIDGCYLSLKQQLAAETVGTLDGVEIASLNGDQIEALITDITDRKFRFLLEHREASLFLHQFSGSPQISDSAREAGYRYYCKLGELLHAGIACERIIDAPPMVLNALTWGPLLNICRAIALGEIDREDIDEATLVAALWRSIRQGE